MFRCGLAILLSYLVLSAGAGCNQSRPTPKFDGSSLFFSAYPKAAGSECKSTTVFWKLFKNQGKTLQVIEITHYTVSGAEVVGHWSCPACRPPILDPTFPALAKVLHRSGSVYMEGQRFRQRREIQGLTAVGQLLDHGEDQNGLKWIIVLDMRFTGTPPRRERDLIGNIISATDGVTFDVCMAAYERAFYAALKRMERYVTEKNMLHQDVNTGNVLFSRDLSDVEFIGWGSWQAMKSWNREETETRKSIAHMANDFFHKSPRRCENYPK